MEISLPISIGEALDKLTILELKLKYISDPVKKINIQKEYNTISPILNTHKNNIIFYYNLLFESNEKIWNLCDLTRDKININYMYNCEKIILENDRRFRIKNKINNILNASLKEQKGYNKKKAFILTHLGLGDNITAIPIVRYLSTHYDEVYVVCKTHNAENVRLFYSDDESIKVLDFVNNSYISPNIGGSSNFEIYTKDCDKYLVGLHLDITVRKPFNYLPFNFYDDLNLPYNIFWKYFYVPSLDNSNKLVNILKDYNINEYIFIHNTSSMGEVFTINFIEEKFNICKNDTLIINPCINVYEKDNKFYNIAELFLNKKLLEYKDVIINASKIFMSDSSFFCLAMNLEIKTNDCYLCGRNNSNYSHIWFDKYGFNESTNKKKFISIIN